MPSKKSLIQFAYSQFQNTNLDERLNTQQRLYQFSMPLLALAGLKDIPRFKEIFTQMETILEQDKVSSQIEPSWKVWMLGRMALACKLINHIDKLKEVKTELTQLLMKHDHTDVITGWSFAYLTTLDSITYESYRNKLFEHTQLQRSRYELNREKEASNFVWTLVMNLYAAASNRNQKDYLHFLLALKTLPKIASLQEASLLVPSNDYRQWLVSLARCAFTAMDDEYSLKELKDISDSNLDSVDAMLAWTNNLLISNSFLKTHSFYSKKENNNEIIQKSRIYHI